MKINWMIGGKVSENWAYGNNVKNLIRYLKKIVHTVDLLDSNKNDIVVYFDPLIYLKNKKYFQNCINIVRIGGIRPFTIIKDRYHINPYKLLSEADHIVTVNDYLSSFIENKTTVIPNSVDLDKFQFVDANINNPVGFVGNVKTQEQILWKGYDLLSKASEKENWYFLVAKRDQYEIPNDQMCQKFYKNVSCIVLPSKSEGCSNTITEALACGIPVITTNKTPNYHVERMKNGEGIIYCDNTVDSIIEKVNFLKSNFDFFEYVRNRGRKFIEENQDIKKVGQIWSNLLIKLREEKDLGVKEKK